MGMYFEFLFNPEAYPGQDGLVESLGRLDMEDFGKWEKVGSDGVNHVWRDFIGYGGVISIGDRLYGELIDGRREGAFIRLSWSSSFDDLWDTLSSLMKLGRIVGFALYDSKHPITNGAELKATVVRYKERADKIRRNFG